MVIKKEDLQQDLEALVESELIAIKKSTTTFYWFEGDPDQKEKAKLLEELYEEVQNKGLEAVFLALETGK